MTFAKIIHVAPTRLRQIEAGKESPTVDELNVIATYTEKSLDFLIRGETKASPVRFLRAAE